MLNRLLRTMLESAIRPGGIFWGTAVPALFGFRDDRLRLISQAVSFLAAQQASAGGSFYALISRETLIGFTDRSSFTPRYCLIH